MSDEPGPNDPVGTSGDPDAEGMAVKTRRRSDEDAARTTTKSRHGILIVSALVAGGAAVVALVLGGMKDNSIYAKSVDELIREKTKFAGKPVRAEGNLVHGSLVKRESPCEYRFTIEKNGTTIPVRFAQCVVPDTFRDVPNMDVGVTVEGKLLADNSFEATNVLAKCPSKYEMKERQGKGEQMPHAAPPTM
ncbi:MAG: cytochrome c maturation protein CcmE [Polyangiaceae bacterium]|nr:cytochrome c maturation protein CcmE [Polyangiaceae bacterium]